MHKLFPLTFKAKINLIFFILISAAVLLTGYMNYRTATDVVEQNAIKMNEQNVQLSAQAFDEKLKKVLLSITSIVFSDDLKELLKDVNENKKEHYHFHMSSLQSLFTQMQFNESLISSILITTQIGDFYSYNDSRSTIAFQDTPLYQQIVEARRAIWVESHEDLLFNDQEKVISYVMELSLDGFRGNSYIIVNIDEGGLRQFLRNSTDSWSQQFILLTREGEPVLDVEVPAFIDPDLLSPASEQAVALTAYNADDTYLINVSLLNTVKSWQLIGFQQKAILFKDVERIKWTTIVIILLGIIAMFIVSGVLTNILTKPMHKLYKLMKSVERTNNLNLRYINEQNEDEFSFLGHRFNFMMDEIRHLVSEIEQVESQKRKAEIKALTAQIDPHFFYNTLNTIYWKSQLGQHDDVKQMILAFSRLFELSLNKGNEFLQLRQELEHVELYMRLQQYCYEQKFQYAIEIAPSINLSLPMMKLILQPLVENSILHGFKHIKAGGMITISLQLGQDVLKIQVIDNGSGMTQAIPMLEPDIESSNSSGYALRNIRERLDLYYDGKAEVQIESTPFAGTTVTLTIPYSEGN